MKNKKLITALLSVAIAGSACSAIVLAACNKKNDAEESGRIIWVAVGGGIDSTGAEDDPRDLRDTLMDDELQPGDTIMVKPGTYNYVDRITVFKGGEYNKYLTIKNADPTQEAVISFYNMAFASTNRGVQIYSNYVHWDGIDICGAGDNGMYIGGSYNIIENSEFYDNRDTGLQLGRSYSPSGDMYQEFADINYWPSYNLIKNCTSYNNYDNQTYGENADGFAAKLTVGYGNVFDGCIAYRNSDDGWDLFAKTDSGNIGAVILYNCVAFENGYILETQEEFNKKFPAFDTSTAENDQKVYTTSKGDGNGFKLGGSIMTGEVFLENCLSFNNRMHGVTDNSNPGVILINNVTSYNNGVGINKDKTSEQFGWIDKSVSNGEDNGCGNINLARQTYSYNHISNTLSVNDGNIFSCDDEYRGTVENSTFSMKDSNVKYTVTGQDEYYSETGDKGVKGVADAATDLFYELPANNLGLSTELDAPFRNPDHSINMGNLLALKDANATQGSKLNLTSWEDYPHYSISDLTKLSSKDEADAQAVIDMTYVPIRTEACYQDFKVVTKIANTEIKWTSSNSEILSVGTKRGTSHSNHSDVTVTVNRPLDADTKVTLTATVTCGEVTKTRDFEINVKKNTFRIGEILIEGLDGDSIIVDKGSSIADYRLATPTVVNGTSDSGVLIDATYYSRTYTVKHGTVTSPNFDNPNDYEDMSRFDVRTPGIWQVTEVITLSDSITLGKAVDGSGTADRVQTKVYLIYVADTAAAVDFMDNESSLTVNKNGYTITGDLTSPTGYVYMLDLPTSEAAPSVEEIKANANTEKREFRATSIEMTFAQENTSDYNVYYFLESPDGTSQSQVYTKQVRTTEVSTKAQFEAMLKTNANNQIFLLQNDLDLEGTLSISDTPFVAVFNGMGHKIYNLNMEKTSSDSKAYVAIFRVVEGGTIMNVTFEDITLTDEIDSTTAIIGWMKGGYIADVKLHNIQINGKDRVGSLIAEVHAESKAFSVTHIERVSVISDKDDDGRHICSVIGDRAGGLVGFLQAGSGGDGWNICYIKDCYVDTEISNKTTTAYAGGIVGRFDARNVNDYLEIITCYFVGSIYTEKYAGGICGGFSGGLGKAAIISCVGYCNIYYGIDRNLLEASEKNGSCITGYFVTNADAIVRNCYAKFDEYNANYGVIAFGYVDDEGIGFPDINNKLFWTDTINSYTTGAHYEYDIYYDFDNVWEFVDNGSTLKAPYIMLK
ncbi:MAG: immunoglobulin-like domain-containing protein [Candidatus Coproplasma sp.]